MWTSSKKKMGIHRFTQAELTQLIVNAFLSTKSRLNEKEIKMDQVWNQVQLDRVILASLHILNFVFIIFSFFFHPLFFLDTRRLTIQSMQCILIFSMLKCVFFSNIPTNFFIITPKTRKKNCAFLFLSFHSFIFFLFSFYNLSSQYHHSHYFRFLIVFPRGTLFHSIFFFC